MQGAIKLFQSIPKTTAGTGYRDCIINRDEMSSFCLVWQWLWLVPWLCQLQPKYKPEPLPYQAEGRHLEHTLSQLEFWTLPDPRVQASPFHSLSQGSFAKLLNVHSCHVSREARAGEGCRPGAWPPTERLKWVHVCRPQASFWMSEAVGAPHGDAASLLG